jgi:toxin ParE1/3/4
VRLRYSETAFRQIDKALHHVALEAPQGAQNIGGRIRAVLALILEHPFAGQATSRMGVRRVLVTPYPYVIYYRVKAEEILVTRFRHTSRRPI